MPARYRVTTLKMGSLNVDSSNVFHGAPGGERVDVPVWAALIEGEGRIIVVDTGIRDPNWVRDELQNPCRQSHEETMRGALAARGLTLGAVDMVISTHLHFDHSGHNGDFALGVQRLVSSVEWRAANDPDSPQRAMYNPSDFLADSLNASSYTMIDGPSYEVAEGVTVIPTPGHSLGHQSVLVQTDEGALCIAGDVANQYDTFANLQPPGLVASVEMGVESIRRIAASCDRLLLAHDGGLTPFMTNNYPAVPKGIA